MNHHKYIKPSATYLGGSKAQLSSGSLSHMRGLTLVELMVAITVMLLITIATAAIYLTTSQGARTVDSSQQLDESARFAFKIVGNAIRNAGYREVISSTGNNNYFGCKFTGTKPSVDAPCPVFASDNTSLALRFYGSGDSDDGDGSMVTCDGRSVGSPKEVGHVGLSAFSIQNDVDGEPSLACTSSGRNRGERTETILSGVEDFQVMYGINVPVSTPSDEHLDDTPNRFVRATEITNTDDWRQVRAIRIGMVLRGATGSQQASDGKDLYPMGKNFAPEIKFTPPNDTRMRRVYTSTFMLRNKIE